MLIWLCCIASVVLTALKVSLPTWYLSCLAMFRYLTFDIISTRQNLFLRCHGSGWNNCVGKTRFGNFAAATISSSIVMTQIHPCLRISLEYWRASEWPSVYSNEYYSSTTRPLAETSIPNDNHHTFQIPNGTSLQMEKSRSF